MKNPNPVNLQTSAEVRKAGWQAECRDADGHLCRTHVPFETDEEIVWLVREAIEHGETVTIWPTTGSLSRSQNVQVAPQSSNLDQPEGEQAGPVVLARHVAAGNKPASSGQNRPHERAEDEDERNRQSEKASHPDVGVVVADPGEPPIRTLIVVRHENIAPETALRDLPRVRDTGDQLLNQSADVSDSASPPSKGQAPAAREPVDNPCGDQG